MAVHDHSHDEEELRKLSMEMRYLEQTAETLQQRISMINAAINDLTYANETLEGIEKEKENSELLIPIGGSAYMKFKLADSDKVIISLGAGVSVEKTLAEAKATIKERTEELEKTLQAGQQQFQQVAERLGSSRNRAQTILANVREGKQ
ncbi:MAG: prefoldin subunit alpha [Candidatus Bathyarchaeota archaeon]|nr:prefoldin subunit alpha [Candidatus Bathyarchaeota archaeon]